MPAANRSDTPLLLFLITLGGLTAFFLIRPALSDQPYYGPRSATGYTYWYLLALAFIPYAFAIRAYRRFPGPSARLLLTAACVLYFALIPAPALQSQDLYQSLLYGKMAVQGQNPYFAQVASLQQDPWHAWALWGDTASVYGPAWTFVTAGIVKASRANLTAAFLLLKATSGVLALLATWALARTAEEWNRRRRSSGSANPGMAVLAFAFNPMVLFSTGLGAHADIAVAAALAGALLAEQKRRDPLVTLLLAIAALVKAYAALFLIAWLICLTFRRGGRTAAGHAAAATGVVWLAYLPFWHGLETFSGLARVGRAASTSLTGTMIRLLSGHPADAFQAGSSHAGTVIRVVAGLLLAACVVAVVRSERLREEPWLAGALLFGAYVVIAPWYLYWHLIGLVALAAVMPDQAISRGALTFSGTSLFVGSGGMAAGLVFQALVRYAPPFVAVGLGRQSRETSDRPRAQPLTSSWT